MTMTTDSKPNVKSDDRVTWGKKLIKYKPADHSVLGRSTTYMKPLFNVHMTGQATL